MTFHARRQKSHLQDRSAAGNIACYGPVLSERANVVIELFVIYKADYSLYNGSFCMFWYSEKCPSIFLVISLSRITIVSGHMIYSNMVYMWHSMVYRSRGNTLSLISALYLWASVGCDVVCCQGILAWYVRGLPGAPLPGASLITQFAHSSWRDDM